MTQVMSARIPLDVVEAVKARAKEQRLNPTTVQKILLDAYGKGLISVKEFI